MRWHSFSFWTKLGLSTTHQTKYCFPHCGEGNENIKMMIWQWIQEFFVCVIFFDHINVSLLSAAVAPGAYRTMLLFLFMEKAHRWVHTLLLCSPVELLTGEALFQTHDSREHLCMMAKIFGSFPKWMGLDAEYAFGVHSVIQTVFCTLQFLSSFVPFLIAVEVGVGLSFEAHTPGDFTHSFTNTNHRKGQWNWLLGFKQHIFFGWYWEVLLCKPLPLPLPDRIRIKFGGSAEGVIGAVYRIRNFFVTTPPKWRSIPPNLPALSKLTKNGILGVGRWHIKISFLGFAPSKFDLCLFRFSSSQGGGY